MYIKIEINNFTKLLDKFVQKKTRNMYGIKDKSSVPRKFTTNTKNQEVYLTSSENELTVSTEFTKISCPVVESNWLGYIYFKFEYLLVFKKYPPYAKDFLVIDYTDDKFKIGSTSIRNARFSESAEFKASNTINF